MIITLLVSMTISFQAIAPIPPEQMPQNALLRVDPKLWGLEFNVVINSLDTENSTRPFRMP